MTQIPGVEIFLPIKGYKFHINSSPYPLEALLQNGDITVKTRVTAERVNDIFSIIVDDAKNIELQKPLANGKEKIYQANIKIRKKGRFFRVENPKDNLRLLELNPGGLCNFWEISIVSQNGKFWCVTQKTRSEFFFLDTNSGKSVCPKMEWVQLNQIININGLIDNDDLLQLDQAA
ncbi:hypothetical protein HOC90_00085 [Candidatus Falkowbacteria bacterium]|jgi:hypothetical protein|nr:hypothetical protein [Candidatus Falkowbacteria bacterium]